MTSLPNPQTAAEAPALPPDERRARKLALQSELETYDELRDNARNVLRSLLTLQHSLDANPVKFRSLYDRNVDACDHYMRHVAALTAEITRLDNELTGLCRHDDVAAMCRMVDGEGLVTPGILAELAGGGR